MQGIIESCEQKTVQKGKAQGNTFYKISVNGLSFSVFDDSVFKFLKTGAEIEYNIELSKDGKYKNIKDIKLIKGVLEGAIQDKPPISGNNYKNDINSSIETQVCLKAAVELYKDKCMVINNKGDKEFVKIVVVVDAIVLATKKFYKEIFEDKQDNSKKLIESQEMNDMVIEIMRMGAEGIWDKDGFDNIRKGVEKRNRNYEELKKLYLNACDDFNARIEKRKEESGDEQPY